MRHLGMQFMCLYLLVASATMGGDKEKKNIGGKTRPEKQNVDNDTSQLSVGKHIPHTQKSQSIYHTAESPSWVCLCVHMCLYCMCVCLYQRGWEMQSTLNY